MTASSPIKVKISFRHEAIGDTPDYHDWKYIREIKCDKRGHPNPRMYSADWQLWQCNNPDCPGQAFVSNDAVRELIDGG